MQLVGTVGPTGLEDRMRKRDMDFDEGTVFILGAGFTKAFLPEAPLLVDDYDVAQLKMRFDSFKTARTVLKLEMEHGDHDSGEINLERLMTRLAGGMPYDVGRKGADKELQMLLYELKQAFLRRLDKAKEGSRRNSGELSLLAGHCLRRKSHCITFNYDDILDESLWKFNQWAYLARFIAATPWTPEWGYGFPCQMSEACVRGLTLPEPPLSVQQRATEKPTEIEPGEEIDSVLLLKLHGSVNWRISLGLTKPYSIDAIRHHEEWFCDYRTEKIPLESIEPFLEPERFFVPPVLTKSDLVREPVLRLIWTLALKKLRKARRVVFIGYSLPITDLAAGFLFREGLRELDHSQQITVVDFAENDKERKNKLANLVPAYKNVFPKITKDQFYFCGAAKWIRDNLTEWLYDSNGKPIAYKALNLIISRSGNLIGDVRGHYHGEDDVWDVWNTSYQGEIVDGNRYFYREEEHDADRGPTNPREDIPSVPAVPPEIEAIALPEGYRDVTFADE